MARTIKQEVDDAAGKLRLGANVPWRNDASRTAGELRATLNEVAAELLARHEWTTSGAEAVLTPTVDQSAWAFPSEFLRLQSGENAVYELSPNRRPILPVPDAGDWAAILAQGALGAQRIYRRTANGLREASDRIRAVIGASGGVWGKCS